MKRLALGLVVAMLAVTMVLAVKPNGPSAYNGLNKGNVMHLYLYEKDANWDPVEDGAWGKMTAKKGDFIFNGHGLEPDMDYTLINYMDPWPGTGSIWMAEGTADEDGNVHMKGSMDGVSGKIWLVSSSDFDGSEMTGWNPSEYLFEYDTI